MKKLIGLVLALSTMVLVGCTEDVDTSARYVFKEKTITDYLTLHEEYDEYVKLLKTTPVSTMSETKVFQLLSATRRVSSAYLRLLIFLLAIFILV